MGNDPIRKLLENKHSQEILVDMMAGFRPSQEEEEEVSDLCRELWLLETLFRGDEEHDQIFIILLERFERKMKEAIQFPAHWSEKHCITYTSLSLLEYKKKNTPE